MLPPLRDYPFKEFPIIAAHRGDSSSGARENSLEAIGLALDEGVEMVEVDVQWTLDGIAVCYHDEEIGEGRKICDSTLEQLTIELGSAAPTPLLSVLELVQSNAYLNLEIKEYSARDPHELMRQLLELVEQAGDPARTLFSSFRADYIRAAGWSMPTIIIQPSNAMEKFFASRAFKPYEMADVESMLPSELLRYANATAYACMLDELTEARLRDIRARNLQLSVYTIVTDDDFKRAVSAGATGMVCENPSHFLSLRNAMFPRAV